MNKIMLSIIIIILIVPLLIAQAQNNKINTPLAEISEKTSEELRTILETTKYNNIVSFESQQITGLTWNDYTITTSTGNSIKLYEGIPKFKVMNDGTFVFEETNIPVNGKISQIDGKLKLTGSITANGQVLNGPFILEKTEAGIFISGAENLLIKEGITLNNGRLLLSNGQLHITEPVTINSLEITPSNSITLSFNSPPNEGSYIDLSGDKFKAHSTDSDIKLKVNQGSPYFDKGNKPDVPLTMIVHKTGKLEVDNSNKQIATVVNVFGTTESKNDKQVTINNGGNQLTFYGDGRVEKDIEGKGSGVPMRVNQRKSDGITPWRTKNGKELSWIFNEEGELVFAAPGAVNRNGLLTC